MRKQFTEMPIMLCSQERWDMFPPESPRSIPFAMLSEDQAQRNHSQSLQRLAERGGLGADEMIAVMACRRWQPMKTEDALFILRVNIGRFNEPELTRGKHWFVSTPESEV